MPGFLKVGESREQPPPAGHFLTNTELHPISSIACLQAKQVNPAVNCSDSATLPVTVEASSSAMWSGELNAGNFPSYKDAACNSEGEFLCDPEEVLSNAERVSVAAELKRLREATPVTCGRLQNDKVDPLHFQPFYLGVAIAKDWPVSQSDPEYLQQFGQIMAAQWNMDHLFVGRTTPYLRCPNTAMLIILPSSGQAYLSTPSCEFICTNRGGPEVVTSTLVNLRSSGVGDATLAGIGAVYRFLGSATNTSNISGSAQEATSSTDAGGRNVVNDLLRALFVLAVFLLVASLGVGILVLCLAPGLIAKQRKR